MSCCHNINLTLTFMKKFILAALSVVCLLAAVFYFDKLLYSGVDSYWLAILYGTLMLYFGLKSSYYLESFVKECAKDDQDDDFNGIGLA